MMRPTTRDAAILWRDGLDTVEISRALSLRWGKPIGEARVYQKLDRIREIAREMGALTGNAWVAGKAPR